MLVERQIRLPANNISQTSHKLTEPHTNPHIKNMTPIYIKQPEYFYPSCSGSGGITHDKELAKKPKISTYSMAFLGICLTAAIAAYPEESFRASFNGLKIWWNIVLPALLPFFIAAEIMMGLGVVHFMGTLLEPVMRPIFKVPGVGAFALAMGLASGYPIGAKITSELRRDNLCSQIEAERLISISNTADPLFMIGAVAVGMFGMPQLGITIAGAHYLSSLLLGLLMRYHGASDGSEPSMTIPPSQENILVKAFKELYQPVPVMEEYSDSC